MATIPSGGYFTRIKAAGKARNHGHLHLHFGAGEHGIFELLYANAEPLSRSPLPVPQTLVALVRSSQFLYVLGVRTLERTLIPWIKPTFHGHFQHGHVFIFNQCRDPIVSSQFTPLNESLVPCRVMGVPLVPGKAPPIASRPFWHLPPGRLHSPWGFPVGYDQGVVDAIPVRGFRLIKKQ